MANPEALLTKMRRRPAAGPGRNAEAHRRPTTHVGRKDRGNGSKEERTSGAGRISELFSQANEARLGYLGPITRVKLNKDDLAVEFGHTDGPAFQDNNTEGKDLRERLPDLDTPVDVQTGPEEAQPPQWTVPDAMDATKTFTVAAFTGEPNLEIEDFDPPADFSEILDRRDRAMNGFVDSQEQLSLIKNRKDLKRVLRRRKRRGLLKGLEGLYVDRDNYMSALDALQEKNFVVIGPSWNHDTLATHTGKPAVRDAEGAKPDKGLTTLGKDIVREIDRRGMVVDLSHASLKTQHDVLSMPSEKPRVFTHAGSRAMTDHPRNVTDDVAKLVINGGKFIREGDTIRILENGDKAPEGVKVHTVKKGGIIGMPFVATFVKKDSGDEKPTVENVVNHLEHFKEIGLLHGIALGTDFAGMGKGDVVEGVENVRVFRKNLREAMLNRDFSKKEVRMVFRENALKFWLKNLPRENQLPRPGEEAPVFQAAA